MSSPEAETVGAEREQPATDTQANGNATEQPEKQEAEEKADQAVKEKENEKQDAAQGEKKESSNQPAGGFDATPLPKAPPGYTLKITFHRASNLPMADVNSLSSDPYIIAELKTDLQTRHKEDPPLRRRTPTIRRSTDPEWECEWIVANVPASGFKLKCRIYDEDPATQDDRLGNAHVNVASIAEGWEGIDNQAFKIKKRSGSKRAYLARIFATCFGVAKHMHGNLYVSVQNLGRTDTEEGGHIYTIGPNWWTKHFSPLLGRIAGTRDHDDGETPDTPNEKERVQRYNFQANQMQLTGPVPWQMYHRFVEFRPFVKSMFTAKGIRGFMLSKALHHQHGRVYAYDRNTLSGVVPPHSIEATKKFLDLVHYDEGGRIFTYVITLDGLWRFTETGKEFGIDMLSKHTMHSNVNIYISFSGEFFIRRLKNKRMGSRTTSRDVPEGNQETHPPEPISGGPPDQKPPKDPAYYELIIDNDSGTYRPNAKLLPLLKQFMEANLPGLKVRILDCQGDADSMGKMKQEQRDRKKKEGTGIIYTQWDQSSISSSEDEALDDIEARQEPHLLQSIKKDQSAKQHARVQKLKSLAKGRDHGDEPAARDQEDGADEEATNEGEASNSTA